jgi:hypothetical protein
LPLKSIMSKGNSLNVCDDICYKFTVTSFIIIWTLDYVKAVYCLLKLDHIRNICLDVLACTGLSNLDSNLKAV